MNGNDPFKDLTLVIDDPFKDTTLKSIKSFEELRKIRETERKLQEKYEVEGPFEGAISRLELPPYWKWAELAKEESRIGLGEHVGRYGFEAIPLWGATKEILDASNLKMAIEAVQKSQNPEKRKVAETKWNKFVAEAPDIQKQAIAHEYGSLSYDDYVKNRRKEVMDAYAITEYERTRGVHALAKVGRGVINLIPYMAEIAASGPLAGVLKAGARKAALKGIKVSTKRTFVEATKRARVAAIGGFGTAAGWMPAFTPRIVAGIARRELPGYEATPEGKIIITKKGMGRSQAALHSVVDVGIEALTEQVGGRFMKGVGNVLGKIPKVKSVLKNISNAIAKITGRTHIRNKVLSKVQYHRFLGELSEEGIGRVIKAAVGVDVTGGVDERFKALCKAFWPGYEEMLIEAAVLAVPGATAFSITKVARLLDKKERASRRAIKEATDLDISDKKERVKFVKELEKKYREQVEADKLLGHALAKQRMRREAPEPEIIEPPPAIPETIAPEARREEVPAVEAKKKKLAVRYELLRSEEDKRFFEEMEQFKKEQVEPTLRVEPSPEKATEDMTTPELRTKAEELKLKGRGGWSRKKLIENINIEPIAKEIYEDEKLRMESIDNMLSSSDVWQEIKLSGIRTPRDIHGGTIGKRYGWSEYETKVVMGYWSKSESVPSADEYAMMDPYFEGSEEKLLDWVKNMAAAQTKYNDYRDKSEKKKWEEAREYAKEESKDYGKANVIVKKDAHDEALKRLLGREEEGGIKYFHAGIDPQFFKDLVTVGAYHLEAGMRRFADWSKKMVADLGERAEEHLPAVWQELESARTKLEGRPELAIPVVAPEARRLMEDVDVQRKTEGIPERREDIDVQAEATVRYESDPVGERKRLLETAETGGQLGDTDTVIAKTIMNNEALEAIKENDLDKIQDAMLLMDAYRRTGTEQARGLRQRRDPVENPAQRRARMLTEAVLYPSRKFRHKIDRARKKGDFEEAKKQRAAWAEKIKDLKKALEKIDVDIARLHEYTDDIVISAKILHKIQAMKGDNWDAAYEYWRCAILSGPLTQLVNIVGNATHGVWYNTAERFVEALANTVLKHEKGAQWGELKYVLGGVLPGLSRGARNFFRSFDAEMPILEEELGRTGTQQVEERGIAIAGTKGRVIRLPQRILLAADELFKSLFAQMEVGAQAYRIAKAEGLKKDALRKRIAVLSTDLESDAWQNAMDTAVMLAFQDRPGDIGQIVLGARRKIMGIRYLFPFITTPWNIFKIGVKKSPLGIIGLGMRAKKGLIQKDWAGITPAIAQQIIGWGAVLALMGNDPDDPWITGARPELGRRARYQARRSYPAQSIYLFGRWWSYSRIEPFATGLSMTIDIVNSFKSKAPSEIITAPAKNLIGQMKNKTFLQGLGDVLKVFESESIETVIPKWMSGFTVSWVPNIVRTTGRATTKYYPQRGVWGKGIEWYKRLGKRTIQRLELGLIKDYPARDVWGRKAPRNITSKPATNFMYNMLVPMRSRIHDVCIGDQVMMNWNNRHPSETIYVVPPPKYYRVAGKTRYMTDEQYDKFCELSGKAARRLVENYFKDKKIDNPTEHNMNTMKKLISKARRVIKKPLVQKWIREEIK